jgi:hypothetical protein
MLKNQVDTFPTLKQPYEWMLDNAKVVKIQSYKDHSYVNKAVETFLGHNEIYVKACYSNAYAMSSMQDDFKYVLGQAPSLIPVDHAWNSYEDFHFDLTNEILHNGKAFEPEYVMFKDFTSDEVYELMQECADIVPDIWIYMNHQRRQSDEIRH